MGLFPSGPSTPGYAFCVQLLFFLLALMREAADSAQALAAALKAHHRRAGYVMRNAKGQPVQEGYRRTLQHALQWFDLLLHLIERETEQCIAQAAAQARRAAPKVSTAALPPGMATAAPPAADVPSTSTAGFVADSSRAIHPHRVSQPRRVEDEPQGVADEAQRGVPDEHPCRAADQHPRRLAQGGGEVTAAAAAAGPGMRRIAATPAAALPAQSQRRVPVGMPLTPPVTPSLHRFAFPTCDDGSPVLPNFDVDEDSSPPRQHPGRRRGGGHHPDGAKRWMNVAAKHGVTLGGVTSVSPELTNRCPACFNNDIYGRSPLE